MRGFIHCKLFMGYDYNFYFVLQRDRIICIFFNV